MSQNEQKLKKKNILNNNKKNNRDENLTRGVR